MAVVTGANQGLGLALVRGLCRQLGDGGVVYLAAGERSAARRPSPGALPGTAPRFRVLDVRDTDAVGAFAAAVREEHGGVDIVLSNAAARRTPDRPEADQIRAVL